MAKKKKSQLKPVARGFATTSVPKKVVENEQNTDDTITDTAAEEAPTSDALHPSTAAHVQSNAPQDHSFDPDKVEEQSLQNLVDKYQEKTEKETLRTIKAIEVDRRFSKTLPSLQVDPALVERIFKLYWESPECERKLLEETEEKLVTRLGITYGVLRRLGFSQDRVDECLRAIQGVDLEEAYEWLYIYCSEDELEERVAEDLDDSKVPRRKRKELQSPTSRSPLPPSTPLPLSPAVTAVSKLDANAPVFVPARQRPASDLDLLKSRDILPAESTRSSPSRSSSPDIDDLVAEYVRIKMQITDLTARGKAAAHCDPVLVQRLQDKLMALKSHYFFDEKDAETQYRSERARVDALLLQSRLRGSSPELSVAQEKKVSKPLNVGPRVEKQDIPVPSDIPDIFDQHEEGLGGMLEILDTLPSEITGEGGSIIRIRDMILPKHWSSKTPKTLLAEFVFKVDRYAAVTYSIVSGPSRAKRACVTVNWEGKRWMKYYVATLALHALTFPATDGFAVGSSGALANHTSFRLLPPVFRDLWDELETDRKLREDLINRQVWANMRNIVEKKIDAHPMLMEKNTRVTTEAKDYTPVRLPPRNDTGFDHIIADFRARQMRPAYQEMLYHRKQLPIAKYRDDILSTLDHSQILVLSGETGCGKSTQVPAFILEDQLARGLPCKIYCTEPRRISAVSLAQRVSRELGDSAGAVGTSSSLVGYSIRLESNTTRNTRLAFVTNGIALRMLEGGTGPNGQGTAFDEITHIIIDEVHERSIESDFLLIVLKSLLSQRSDLKIILMSATVDADKLSNYFNGCPTLHVPGRTFPVDVRFLEDAIEYADWSIQENSPYAINLHNKSHKNRNRFEWDEDTVYANDDEETLVDGGQQISSQSMRLEKRYSSQTINTVNLLDERAIPYELILHLLERLCFEDKKSHHFSAAVLIFMPGLGEIRRMNDLLTEHHTFGDENSFRLYPLHSTLSSDNQSAVFDIPPQGVRKIVIATNIAETGITIPDITCVIDTGKHREMRFDEKRQLSRLVETFVAKSNAAQRRGRAGRVQNGLCFHLFTKIRHDTLLAEHPLPEMMRLSLSDLALRIKIMKVKIGTSIEDVLSRALDPPTPVNVQRAISALVEVRALTPSEDITPMGRLLSMLPTDVHLGKFLLTAVLFRCLDPALTIAAALSSKSPFIVPMGMEQEADRAKSSFRVDNSDFLTIHNAFSSWRRASENPSFVRKFCRVNFLSHQNLQQIEELRQQFLGFLVDSSFITVDRSFIRELSRARFGRNRTRFVNVPPLLDSNGSNIALINSALTAGLYPKVLAIDSSSGQMRTISNNQSAAFHPTSVNFGRKPAEFGVHHLVYFTLMHSKKMYAWETGPIDDLAIVLLCGESEFKIHSNMLSIDRKIRYQLAAKANVALKILRQHLTTILALQLRGKPLTESQVLWYELATAALGKIKLEMGDESTKLMIKLP
ncbi:P-loop containing nucleoside triphosphate hydrolase protein [Suillus subalutaceus]|uniref:P-loop containing nucleoside triphosphate hydrolase protein n=1 Tax=Suillus subalutaceus TaxID=48586 RepID=UPI001B867939|nr:P-loop containing nucleoside triphosphate hydrolase protein [Suillus subalutaceus]KAG1867923.1 P-loop containing nucleoside triphosphate hydrolase protein [Suillus subalutaceus]